MQICDDELIGILKSAVYKDHIRIEYGPLQSVSYLVKKLKKGRSKKLKQEFPVLEKIY